MINLVKIFIFSFLILSCTNKKKDNNNSTEKNNKAFAIINSASGSSLEGTAYFTVQHNGKVLFELEVNKTAPGEHAVHLHAKGDCSAQDATSAAGHWNPSGHTHGHREVTKQYHAGDIENLVVGNDSIGKMKMEVNGWKVGSKDEFDVVGKGIIIHAVADDFKSQPSGAAGARIGCGVIRLQN